MTKFIQLDDQFSVKISDEPCLEYYNIMLKAGTDDHNALKDNYREHYLKKSTYYFLVYDGDTPFVIWFVTKLDNGTARVFERTYRDRDANKWAMNWEYEKKLSRVIVNIYDNHPEIKEELGVHTVFFTRNYKLNNDAKKYKEISIERILGQGDNTSFIMSEKLYIYHGVPQRFYINGDSSFLNELEEFTDHSKKLHVRKQWRRHG